MVELPSKTPSLRRYSYNSTQTPPVPPRRQSVPLQLVSVTQSGGMDSRYYRPSSPRGRLSNPARSSTGTFGDPYYDSTYYARPSSPRSSAERIAGSHYPQQSYASSGSSGSRSSNYKYDSYSGRPRRNTVTEQDDRSSRPNLSIASTTSIPIRAPGVQTAHYDRPSSPLSQSWDTRGDTYITHGGAPRREHKRIYSVDDNSHATKLVAEKSIGDPRRESRGYNVTSGGRTYHQHKPPKHNSDVGDADYSYTDPASMYRDTEPAWRRPRSGSVERGSRPSSMIMERGARASNRELGPPPSTRGFDKINSSLSRNGHHHHHGRSSSIERARDVPKYEAYPDAAPARSASTRHHAPAIHQEPREHRRDTYHDEYDRRGKDVENRRYNANDQFEDREVASRGFGIAPAISSHGQEPSLDRQPLYNAQAAPRARAEDYGKQYYSADRAEARMPEPRLPHERDVRPTYEERPRERDRDRRDGNNAAPAAVPVAAGAVAGAAAATYGATELLRSRDRDRDRDRDRNREYERERENDKDRERRRERDERDRRDRVSDDRRDDRRDRVPEDRKDRPPPPLPPAQQERLPPAIGAYPLIQDADIKPRERRYEDNERDRRSRKALPSEDSGDERPRHYVDRDAGREAERRKEPVLKEAALDPDEEYRRRIQQEAERSGRARDENDPDRDRERRRRRDEREKSRERPDDIRSRDVGPSFAEPSHSRYNERSSSVLDTDIVQEPDSITSPSTSKTVQIVAPPKEPTPAPKGILRKPTEKFPEDPEPIREGVAPHKSQLKGKDIPVNARWTKIDRRLVNPEALHEAQERFEERLDCVIVLRVLTKQEIQKLADRTKEIREAREDEDDYNDRRERDRRSHRSHRDDEDRDRRREYDDYSDDDYDLDRERERERERDRPREIEAPRFVKTQCVPSEYRDWADNERSKRVMNGIITKRQHWDQARNDSSDRALEDHRHRRRKNHNFSSDDKGHGREGKRQMMPKDHIDRVLGWL